MAWDDCAAKNWNDCRFKDWDDCIWDMHSTTFHSGRHRERQRGGGKRFISAPSSGIMLSREIDYLDMMREKPDKYYSGISGPFKKPYRAGNKSKPEYMEYKGEEAGASILGDEEATYQDYRGGGGGGGGGEEVVEEEKVGEEDFTGSWTQETSLGYEWEEQTDWDKVSSWCSNEHGGTVWLAGSWATNYHPTHARITFGGCVEWTDLYLVQTTDILGPLVSGEIFELDLGGTIQSLLGGGGAGGDWDSTIDITKTEFYVLKSTALILTTYGSQWDRFFPDEIKVRYSLPAEASSATLDLIDEASNIILHKCNANNSWQKIQWVGKNELYQLTLTPDVEGELCMSEIVFR